MMPSRPMLVAAVAGALVLGGGLACHKKKTKAKPVQKQAELSAREVNRLFEDGQNLLKRGNWEAGRKALRTIEERYPSSPEFPKAKLLIADSFFFSPNNAYAEAAVEYQSYLSYFPQDEHRDYVQYRIALCHYAAIENAERDQANTRAALKDFQQLLAESPGSPYAVEAKAKILQCWRRLAEAELMVGIFYVKTNHFIGAETRLKQLLETYPDYVDRERAYFFLGEAMRQKMLPPLMAEQLQRTFLERVQKEDMTQLSKAERDQYQKEYKSLERTELDAYREEAKGYFRKLVESYPNSVWAGRAKDRLFEMGQAHLKEELDS